VVLLSNLRRLKISQLPQQKNQDLKESKLKSIR